MDKQTAIFEGAFSAPVYDAQRILHGLMHALANPGQISTLDKLSEPPAPCSHLMGSIALTVLDQDSPVWCDEVFSTSKEVTSWLTFHTGAPIVTDPKGADFALINSSKKMPLLSDFAQGNQEYPDRSTTIILQVSSLNKSDKTLAYILRGPGIDGCREVHIDGLPNDFLAQWKQNNDQFPCGVDLILVAGNELLALPRTTKVQVKET